jgi:hypothetical protein
MPQQTKHKTVPVIKHHAMKEFLGNVKVKSTVQLLSSWGMSLQYQLHRRLSNIFKDILNCNK